MNLLQYLTDSWIVDRTIHDRLAGTTSPWTGTAQFTPVDGALRYEETGTLQLVGSTLATSRAYLYKPTGEWTMDVHFDDGRFFHALDLTEHEWHPLHLCGNDTYNGHVLVRNDGLDISWRITGPTKNLVIASELSRV